MRTAFGADRLRQNAPLAPLTTFRVGGPADGLLETRNGGEIVTALKLCAAAGVPVTILGGGSNVLVADAGVRGLVIRTRGGEARQVDATHIRADLTLGLGRVVHDYLQQPTRRPLRASERSLVAAS